MHPNSTVISLPPKSVKLLTEKEVAQITGISISTLQKYRFRGIGIPYCKIGKSVRYPETCVTDFIEKHLIPVT